MRLGVPLANDMYHADDYGASQQTYRDATDHLKGDLREDHSPEHSSEDHSGMLALASDVEASVTTTNCVTGGYEQQIYPTGHHYCWSDYRMLRILYDGARDKLLRDTSNEDRVGVRQ